MYHQKIHDFCSTRLAGQHINLSVTNPVQVARHVFANHLVLTSVHQKYKIKLGAVLENRHMSSKYHVDQMNVDEMTGSKK